MTKTSMVIITGVIIAIASVAGVNGFWGAFVSGEVISGNQSSIDPTMSGKLLMASSDSGVIDKADLEKEAEAEEPLIKLDDPLDWKGPV